MTTPSLNPLRNKHRRHQRGAAMLILMLMVMLGLITLFTFRMDRKGPELNADRKTALALAQAKEALLGNSATNNVAGGTENPGSMPCPDQDNDGGWGKGLPPSSTLATCPSSANVGRLPWYFLRLDDIRDGSAERLWLVVDPAFIDRGGAINSNTPSTLIVDGKSVVLAIMAPGPAIAGQNRSGAGVKLPASYLESYTNPITTLPLSATYNDRILTITAKELFTVVTFRMARELAIANKSGPPYSPLPSNKIADLLSKPLVWINNHWDDAVEGDGTTSKVTTSTITLKFTNCAIVYTIAGTSNVTRSATSC